MSAVRAGELLVDTETGEILSEQDPGLDELCRLLKDGQDQEKTWKAYNALLKSAIGRKLDEAGLRRALTPSGSPMWRTRISRSAPIEGFKALAERYGLTDVDLEALGECVSELDPKKLDKLRAEEMKVEGDADIEANGALIAAIEWTIQEKSSSYVQLMPLRKPGPTIEVMERTR